MRVLCAFAILIALTVSACGLNRGEYERMRALRDEYLSQLADVRQSNEIINRNVVSAFQEIDALRKRLDERITQARDRRRQQAVVPEDNPS
jgi:chromosome condensin MukBEF ATPase and DNA-binding subunit MukB